MEPAVTITVADLERALRKWDLDAEELEFADRADDGRFADAATYLFGILDA